MMAGGFPPDGNEGAGDNPADAPDLTALQATIDEFVAATLETLATADAACPAYDGEVQRVIASIGEIEALMALLRQTAKSGADGHSAVWRPD